MKPPTLGTIWTDCIVKVIDGDRWKTIERGVVFTPRHINDVMKAHEIDHCWVFWIGGRNIWHKGKELAKEA